MQDDPPLPIDQRIRAAYFRARQRDGAPVRMLDGEFNTMQARLARARNPDYGAMAGGAIAAHAAGRDKILTDAEALFSRWADMPLGEMHNAVFLMQYPPVPRPTPQQEASQIIAELEAHGLKLDAMVKTFRVSPASKLNEKDKARLQRLKAAVLAELQHRADAWSPE